MRLCEVDNCNDKYFALGFCQKHYVKFKKYGDPLAGKSVERHKMTKTSEYKAYWNMKTRCYNKNGKDYLYYGGRGIIVCDRWLYSFLNFYEDMGDKPFPKAQIDRIENNGNYCKSNCHWITRIKNMRNSSATKLNEFIVFEIRSLYENKNYTVTQLCDLFKLKYSHVYKIIKYEIWIEK